MTDRPESPEAIPDGVLLDDDETLEIPITGVLDLHAFRPSEVSGLVREYIEELCARGIREFRIVHGKGIGQQRQMVRTLLERDPRVLEFGDAP